jgi:hypothetical protein
MDKTSQFVARAKVKRGDGKGGNANRDKDQIEEKDRHWVILFGASVHRRLPLGGLNFQSRPHFHCRSIALAREISFA